jgi:hypothetical protein
MRAGWMRRDMLLLPLPSTGLCTKKTIWSAEHCSASAPIAQSDALRSTNRGTTGLFVQSSSTGRGMGMRPHGNRKLNVGKGVTPHPHSLPMNLKAGRRCPQRAVVPCQPPSRDSSSSPGALRTASPYQPRRVQGFTARSSLRRILSPLRGEGGLPTVVATDCTSRYWQCCSQRSCLRAPRRRAV